MPQEASKDMAVGIGRVEVKSTRGKLELQGLGQTPKGQKFVRKTVPINSKGPSEKGFKNALELAVKELLETSP